MWERQRKIFSHDCKYGRQLFKYKGTEMVYAFVVVWHGGIQCTVTCSIFCILNQEDTLTLRLLMSYIYIWHLFLMFLDHTQRRSAVGRTPLDE